MPALERRMNAPLLEVSRLSVDYRVTRQAWWRHAPDVRALDEVSFHIAPGEIVGVVGESGSGKSTLARAILRLTPATAGAVRFEGVDLQDVTERAMRPIRRRMQVIFQDPSGSLNPRMSVGDNVAEGIAIQRLGSPARRRELVAELLTQVGLAVDTVSRYPHELSGGQKQRVGIARALAVDPVLIVADEPVSALDLSVQAQILNLLLEQQQKRNLGLLFIGHDLGVIRHFCDRVIVLYRGRIAEIGPTHEILADPHHPYTRSLIDAAPVPHPGQRRVRPALSVEASTTTDRPVGCAYAARCAHVLPVCTTDRPELRSSGARAVACVRDGVAGAVTRE